MFIKQTEKQVILGTNLASVKAEETDLGKVFLQLSSTQTFPSFQ